MSRYTGTARRTNYCPPGESVLVVLHRWVGLCTAVFLFIAGITGAIIAWEHELDGWLNPAFHVAQSDGPVRSSLELAEQLEARDARLRVRYVPLHAAPGAALHLFVEPRVDARGQPQVLDFDQVALDPSSGAVQATRRWGEPSLSREHLLPFLYKLHYSLHLPSELGTNSGVLLMGIVAVAWFLDAFVALLIAFPSRKSWRRSFAFRVREGGYRLQFDLHRSGGVWLWLLLAVFAFTAISMNLRTEVVRPLVSLISPLTSGPFDGPRPALALRAAAIDRVEALQAAQQEARRRGITLPAGAIAYLADVGLYGVGFFPPGRDRGDGGLGNPWLYLDARDGRLVHADVPGEGSAGDLFMQAQFPIHSGRIAGLWGRACVSALGLAIAMLAVTGVIIWSRKRRARVHQARKLASANQAELKLARTPNQVDA